MDQAPQAALPARLPPVPSWARPAPPTTETEAAFKAGAALALLDARVRADAPFAGVWRRRLALKAAAASARLMRRGEDETTLRDAFFLRPAGADPGPGGRLLLAWRALESPRARTRLLDDDVVVRVAGLLDLKLDDGLRAAIADAEKLAISDQAAPLAAAAAGRVAQQEVFSLWLADAVLAARLHWPRPLPLLAGALLHPSLRIFLGRRPHPGDPAWATSCCAAYARAAVQACELFAELAKNSQKLRAVEPRLRAKGAKTVIAKLHDEDAVPRSARLGTISDRGLRRLFDRLVALGAVRELTDRPTFRIYGL